MADHGTLAARLRRRLTLEEEEMRQVPRLRIKQQDEVNKHLTLNDQLGEGTFATVYTGSTKIQPTETRAIKVIDRRTSHWKLLEAECAVLERIKHDHIIELFMIIEAPKYLYLVLEWCRYGELETKVREMPENRVPDRTAAHITLQLADALAYLHHNDIAHRDVKCNNVLLRNCPSSISKDMDILQIADPDEQRIFATAWDVCLTDFGLSAENKRAPAMMAVCGTVVTMAPEVLADVGLYSPLCDVWSLGVVMFRLLTGRYPYQPRQNVDEMLQQIKTHPVNFDDADIDPRAADLITYMMKIDPAWRFTAKEVMRHPWVSEQSGDMTKSILMMMREFTREEQDGSSTTSPKSGGLTAASNTFDSMITVPRSRPVSGQGKMGLASARTHHAGNTAKHKREERMLKQQEELLASDAVAAGVARKRSGTGHHDHDDDRHAIQTKPRHGAPQKKEQGHGHGQEEHAARAAGTRPRRRRSHSLTSTTGNGVKAHRGSLTGQSPLGRAHNAEGRRRSSITFATDANAHHNSHDRGSGDNGCGGDQPNEAQPPSPRLRPDLNLDDSPEEPKWAPRRRSSDSTLDLLKHHRFDLDAATVSKPMGQPPAPLPTDAQRHAHQPRHHAHGHSPHHVPRRPAHAHHQGRESPPLRTGTASGNKARRRKAPARLQPLPSHTSPRSHSPRHAGDHHAPGGRGHAAPTASSTGGEHGPTAAGNNGGGGGASGTGSPPGDGPSAAPHAAPRFGWRRRTAANPPSTRRSIDGQRRESMTTTTTGGRLSLPESSLANRRSKSQTELSRILENKSHNSGRVSQRRATHGPLSPALARKPQHHESRRRSGLTSRSTSRLPAVVKHPSDSRTP